MFYKRFEVVGLLFLVVSKCLFAQELSIDALPDGISGLVLNLKVRGCGQVLDSREILSRYRTPEYEMRDVTGDGIDDVLVYTQGGGSGTWVEQMMIYAVCGIRLTEAARFDMEGGYCFGMSGQLMLPDGKQEDFCIKEGKCRGLVKFLSEGELLYFYAEIVRDCSEQTLESVIEHYRFNPVTTEFELKLCGDGVVGNKNAVLGCGTHGTLRPSPKEKE